MAIVGNKASEIGDIILIKGTVPIVGLLSIASFEDETIGETADKYFVKEFKYSIDGINWSSWILLSDLNLSDIVVESNDTFFVDYRYIRSGSDATGDLYFTSITLNGEFLEPTCGEIYKKSIFADFFGCHDPEVIGWAINVANKVYNSIAPKFITRGQSDSITDDEDFIDFFKSISWFFAFHVIYSRKFQYFKNHFDLLLDYLRQRNIFIADQELQEGLLYILQNYFDEIRQRGTIQIIREKSSNKAVNGELLRIIGYNPVDEFLFSLLRPEISNWNIGTSSPNYRGTLFDNMLIKGFEKTESVQSLDNYPLINESDVQLIDEDGINVIEVTGSGEGSGIGYQSDITKAIKIDHKVSYEITFKIKQDDIVNEKISFRIAAFDETENIVPLESSITGLSENNFFVDKSLNQADKYYFIRGVIYGSNTPNLNADQARLNIGFGDALRFRSNIKKIIPEVIIKTV
jgi:hypothetical protein